MAIHRRLSQVFMSRLAGCIQATYLRSGMRMDISKSQLRHKNRAELWQNSDRNSGLGNPHLSPRNSTSRSRGFKTNDLSLISFFLLQVCVKGYHKSMSRCTKCPSLPILITQMFFIACALFLLIFILVRDERRSKSKGRTLSDVVLARLKIVVAFYQVFQYQ